MSCTSLLSLGQHFILISIRDENKLFVVLIPFLTRLYQTIWNQIKSPLQKVLRMDWQEPQQPMELLFHFCLQPCICWWEWLEGKITSLNKISTFLRFSFSALFSSADPTAKNNWQRFFRGLHITYQDWQLLVLGSSSIPRIYWTSRHSCNPEFFYTVGQKDNLPFPKPHVSQFAFLLKTKPFCRGNVKIKNTPDGLVWCSAKRVAPLCLLYKNIKSVCTEKNSVRSVTFFPSLWTA